MVEWIRVDTGISQHDKIYNLADILEIPDAHAVGLMVCLWTWAAGAAHDGDITNFPVRAIAKAAGWTKKPEVFFEAICSPLSQFVESITDPSGKVRRVLRNWETRASLLIDYVENQREKNRNLVSKHREKKQDSVTLHTTDSDVTCNVTNDDDVTPQNVTCNADVMPVMGIQYSTLQNNTVKNSAAAATAAAAAVTAASEDNEIGLIQQCYEKYIGMISSSIFLEIQDFLKSGVEAALICRAIEKCVENNVRKWSYVRRILTDCVTNAILTFDKFKQNEADWLESKARPKQKGGGEDAAHRRNHEEFNPGNIYKTPRGFVNALDGFDDDGNEIIAEPA